MIRHTYWRIIWTPRSGAPVYLYGHQIKRLDQTTPVFCWDTLSIELVSVTGGVRTVTHTADDPEFNFNHQGCYINTTTNIRSREYHRKRWKVLQKMRGKK